MFLGRNNHRARSTATFKWAVPMLMATASGMLVAAPAQAQSLQQVTGWSNGDVPSYISMYIYVPVKLPTAPPIMVAAHYCGGNAAAYFSYDSPVVTLANQYGFIMIFPQTTNAASSPDCWDVGSPQSLTRNGGGDTQAIVEMVDYTITHYSANAGRVYAMGSSSGAMLTEVLLGLYPDVFKAGAEMSGVPDGCWSDGWTAASNWGGTCASGSDTMTAAAWGNLVRAQYPSYAGVRPRAWLWVGTADATISPTNFTQSILEWTNVLGLSSTPTSTPSATAAEQQLGSGQLWSNSCGDTVLEAWSLAGGAHAPAPTASTASAIVSFFGLDNSSATDPGAGCGDAGSGGADASTGGTDASTGGADASTRGADASSRGADASAGGADASTGGADASTVGADASTGDVDASFGGDDASTGGDGASTGGADAITGGDDAGNVESDATTGLGSDGGVGERDATGGRGSTGLPPGVIVSNGSASDFTDSSGCSMAPNTGSGGGVFGLIASVIGIASSRFRRRRSS